MPIAVGDKLPLDKISLKSIPDLPDGACGKPQDHSGDELFKGKRVMLFAVPGAFTPSCSEEHLPSFLEKFDDIKAHGIDSLICVSTNDCFVTRAWAKDKKADGKVQIVADGDASFAKLLELTVDTGAFGGTRISRFSAIVDDGEVKKLNLEEGGAYSGVSGADQALKDLEELYPKNKSD